MFIIGKYVPPPLNITCYGVSSIGGAINIRYKYSVTDVKEESGKVSFNCRGLTSAYCMFQNCTSITSIEFATFDTSNISDMSFMFDGCTKLASIDLSSFDTSNVKSFDSMFNAVAKYSDLRCTIKCPQGLDLSKASSISSLFYKAKFTQPIHLKNVPSKFIASGSSSSDWTLISDFSGYQDVHYIVDSVIG